MNTNNINFGDKFCPERLAEVKKLIDSSVTTSIIGVPGVGISIFLKYLTTQPFANFIYIDVFGLPNLSTHDLFKALLTKLGGNAKSKSEGELVTECKERLEKLSQINDRVVICFGGFDQLKSSFSQDFFHHLRSIRNVNQQKIVFIFGICRRLETLISEDLMDTDLNMLSSVYYLKPYSKDDLSYLLSIYGPNMEMSKENLQELLELSGGHFQFLQLLLRSERLNNPASDPFMKLALRNIYQHLTYRQKKIVQKVAVSGTYDKQDDYLTKVGLVIQENGEYKLFSSILESYVKSQTSEKLPTKEAKLFSLLKNRLGKVVSKDEIFESIWKDDSDEASDWALDALIYRLRRHPAFVSKGYLIENQKKQGYTLVKN